jgi:N-acetylmuramoyl-L-alanine amidase
MNGKDTRTSEQKAALERVLKLLKVQFPQAKIRGHRDFSPDKNRDGKITPNEYVKLCPCFNAEIEYKHL